MAGKTILFNIDIETSGYIKKVREAEINVANLKNAQQELEAQLTEIGDTFGYNSQQYLDATNKLKQYDAQIKVATKDVANANKQLEDQVRFTNAAEGSYEQLYRQWKNAEIALKTQAGNLKLAADGTYQLTEQGKAAAAQVLKLKEGVLTFNAEIKDGRLNVGNYSDALEKYGNKLQQAVGGNTALGRAVGGLGDVITSTSAGLELLKDGVSGIQGAFGQATNNVTKFFSTTKGNSFDVLNEGAADAVTNITNVGEAGGDAGKQIAVGTNVGANGFKLLRTALISTGIGAIVVAVGALVSYFLSLQSVTDKLRGVFAGLGAAFQSITKSITDIIVGLASLDFSRVGDALSNFIGNAKEAGGAAYDLNQAKIDLEETDIRNIALLDEANDKAERNRLISQDRTRTDEERIKAFEESIDAEIEALQIQKEREEQAVKLAQKEVDLANKSGEATREQIKALEEAKKVAGDVQDAILNAEIRRVGESSRIRNQLKNDTIKSDIDLLNNRLKFAELSGKETFDLQRRLAKEQLEAEKSDGQKNAKEKEVLESNYRLRLAEISKAEAEAEKQRLQELEQFKIQNIFDGQAREIAAIAFATKQRLDAVVKGTKEEMELRKAISEQGAKEMLAIAQKYAQQTAEERNQVISANLKLQQDEVTGAANRDKQLLDLELSRLATKQNLTEEEIAFQNSAAQRSLEIEEQRLQGILNAQLQAQAQRQASDKAYYDGLVEQTNNSRLGEEAKQIQLAEIEKQRRAADLQQEQEYGAAVTATVDAINNNRVQKTIATNNQIAEDNKRLIETQRELDAAVIDSITTGLSAISEVIGLNEANQKKYAGVLKAISAAELIINLQREISGYWAGVARDTATGGFILGTVSSAKATAQTIAASVRAAAGLAKIAATKYAEGGYTVGDAVKDYNPTLATKFSGGFVRQPTMWAGAGGMKLAGEAGTEWVSPSWQLKQAPGLFSALESWRRTGIKPFADGGFTSSAISQPIAQSAEMVENAIIRGFMAAPAPVVSVQEINDIQTRVSVIESRAAL